MGSSHRCAVLIVIGGITTAVVRARERTIKYAAMHDRVTGLLNRAALERSISELAASVEPPRQIAVVALSIARYPHIRGALGFALADSLFAAVAAKLVAAAPGAVVARLSDAVLGLALPIADEQSAIAFAAQLLTAGEGAVQMRGQLVDIDLFAGFELMTGTQDMPDVIVNRACIALEKAPCGTKIHRFDALAYGDPASNLSLMGELADAIVQGHLTLDFQPKLNLRNGTIQSAEALVRWNHRVRGLLVPGTFVGMAEETGHIHALTHWVIDSAIVESRRLAHAGHPLKIAVNISGRLMSDPGFAEAVIARVGAAASSLIFEITETYVIEKPLVALAAFRALSKAGIEISIDDYGSGYSSLAYLKDLPAGELKIDRLFMSELDTDARNALLIKSTIDLGHALGMKVTAEGVESGAALAALQTMGCDMAQGFFIARPMSSTDLVLWLNSRLTVERASARQ